MAAKCLRLAAAIHDPSSIDALRKLAEEYEKAAIELLRLASMIRRLAPPKPPNEPLTRR